MRVTRHLLWLRISKHTKTGFYCEICNLSFHSLQTGKDIASWYVWNLVEEDELFPFPSNGKVYCKAAPAVQQVRAQDLIVFPFPSNGKVYYKIMLMCLIGTLYLICFHSLQTGKCIASL